MFCQHLLFCHSRITEENWVEMYVRASQVQQPSNIIQSTGGFVKIKQDMKSDPPENQRFTAFLLQRTSDLFHLTLPRPSSELELKRENWFFRPERKWFILRIASKKSGVSTWQVEGMWGRQPKPHRPSCSQHRPTDNLLPPDAQPLQSMQKKSGLNKQEIYFMHQTPTIIIGSTPTLPDERVEASQSAWLGVSGSPSCTSF